MIHLYNTKINFSLLTLRYSLLFPHHLLSSFSSPLFPSLLFSSHLISSLLFSSLLFYSILFYSLLFSSFLFSSHLFLLFFYVRSHLLPHLPQEVSHLSDLIQIEAQTVHWKNAELLLEHQSNCAYMVEK